MGPWTACCEEKCVCPIYALVWRVSSLAIALRHLKNKIRGYQEDEDI
jgi:hypothetical protein